MTKNPDLTDSEFEELKKVFYSQAYEIIEDLQNAVLRLEADPEDENTLKAIKRYVHTLKGDSNSFGLTSLGTLCHRIEDIFPSIMDESGYVDPEAVDLLLSCVDKINRILQESESGKDRTDTKDMMERIEGFLKKSSEFRVQSLNLDRSNNVAVSLHQRMKGRSENPPIPPLLKGVEGGLFTEYQELQIKDALEKGINVYEIETVFHPMCEEKGVAALMMTQKLNSIGQVIRSAPELESSDIDRAEKITFLISTNLDKEDIKRKSFIAGITDEINIRGLTAEPESEDKKTREWGGEKSQLHNLITSQLPNHKSEMLRIEVSKVDTIMNLVGELIIGRSMIEQIAREIEDSDLPNDISFRLFSANSYMERTVSAIQMGVMRMRMVPINHVFRKFPKVIRELSAEKKKKVRLDIFGKETELDRGIVDALGEPLSHIIRNSIDHGIEEPEYRKSAGKPEEGVITLRAYHEAGKVVIEVSDDGKGIDVDRLKRKAVERGFIDQSEIDKLPDTEAINLIFLSGLSTSETVCDTSGRGIGMDAVKSAITAMRGSIEVESTQGTGTKFQLRLPLTLAIIKALLFSIGERIYAVPISVIAEVTRIMTEDLVTVDGKDTLMLRDRIISIIHMEELFGINGGEKKKKYVLLLSIGSRRVGIIADHLIGQQEIVIKAVEGDYLSSDLIAGASILGDGKVVIILDVHALFRKAVEEEKAKITLPFIPSRQERGDKPIPSPLEGENYPILPSPHGGEG